MDEDDEEEDDEEEDDEEEDDDSEIERVSKYSSAELLNSDKSERHADPSIKIFFN